MSLVLGASAHNLADNEPYFLTQTTCYLILPGNIKKICFPVSFRPKKLTESENLYALILIVDIELRKKYF